MPTGTDTTALRSQVPEGAWPVVEQWLRQNPVLVRTARNRKTKLGDFRSATRTLPHRISVNADLNKYSFLVTLVHEFAHYTTHLSNGRRAAPHGNEWKLEYGRLMRPFLSHVVFPPEVLPVLERHLEDAPASSCADPELMRALMKYDAEPRALLEALPEKALFHFNGSIFVKGPRLRKRYKCHCLNNRRTYLIDQLAEVRTNEPAVVNEAC